MYCTDTIGLAWWEYSRCLGGDAEREKALLAFYVVADGFARQGIAHGGRCRYRAPYDSIVDHGDCALIGVWLERCSPMWNAEKCS